MQMYEMSETPKINSDHFEPIDESEQVGKKIFSTNQPLVPSDFQQFNENNRIKPFTYYNRMVCLMEELIKFTILTHSCSDYMTIRYSKRTGTARELITKVNKTT